MLLRNKFNRSDFEFTYPAGVKYLHDDVPFERKNRLTKWDIATILDTFEPFMYWCRIYDAFSYADLCMELNKQLLNTSML